MSKSINYTNWVLATYTFSNLPKYVYLHNTSTIETSSNNTAYDTSLGLVHPPIPVEKELPYMMGIKPEAFSRLLKYSLPVIKGLATPRQVRDSARELALTGKVGMITLVTGAKLYIRRDKSVFYHYAESYVQNGSDIDPYLQEVQ